MNLAATCLRTLAAAAGVSSWEGCALAAARRRLAELAADGAARRLSSSSFEVDYTISYDPAVVTVDVVTLAAAVETSAAAAVSGGGFAASLATYMPAEYASAVTVTAVAVAVVATSAPTFWSDTAEADPTPPVILRRIGGEPDLPACGCDQARAAA